MGLGRVLDERQAVLLGDGLDGGHVGGLAVEADRHDRLRPGRDGGLDRDPGPP